VSAARPPMLAADFIRQLVKPYPTTESVTQPTEGEDGRWRTVRRLHTVHHASLLDQLNEAITGASALSDEDAGRSTFGSKPAARLEALAVINLIETESHELAVDLNLEEAPRTKTKVKRLPLVDRLLAISGAIGDKEHPAAKRWWTAARITTQWESRPFHPKGAPCPQCWETSSLRVVLSEELARCTECGHTWDDGGFRVLAHHVKWCTDHEVTKPRHWLVDDDGFPTECIECLTFRDAYAEWKLLNAAEKTSRLLTVTRHAEGN
jgi:Zn ribbon nucleic-acid-binding protein